jgi:thioredoxin-like negative regulator of GroEL
MDDIFGYETGVRELKNKEFIRKEKGIYIDSSVKSSNIRGLVLFYTPWGRSCNDFKYKWSEIALLFKNRFFIGAVNVENQKSKNDILRHDLEITTYPTIKYVSKNGKLQKYGGTKNINEIVHFICKKEKIKC